MREYVKVNIEKPGYRGIKKYELEGEYFGVGISRNNHISIPVSVCGSKRTFCDFIKRRRGKPTLSRWHLTIILENGKRRVVDEGSRTGTFVNGERISEKGCSGYKDLKNGDIIGLVKKGSGFLIEMEYVAEDQPVE